MLLSDTAIKAEKHARATRPFRAEGGGATAGATPGVFCCSNCGLPQFDAHRALWRERRLVERLLEEHETFKQSLSDEIYEGFNQQLIGALMHLQGFEQLQQENPAEAQAVFRTGLELLRDTLDEARRVANRLKPPVLDDFGIVEGVHHLLDQVRRMGCPAIEFLSDGDFDGVAPRTKSIAFRIIQELLLNACNHSGSAKVRLGLARRDGFLRITVEDWGVGFHPARVDEDYLGLRKVREHALLLGGRAGIRSAPGKGTRVAVDLPISIAAARAQTP